MLRGYALIVLAMLAPVAVGAEENRDFAYTEPCTLFSQDEAGTALGKPTTGPRQWVSVIIIGPQADFNCNFKDYLPNARGETVEFDVRGVFSRRMRGRRSATDLSAVEIVGLSGKASWFFVEGSTGDRQSDGSTGPPYPPLGELTLTTTEVEFVVTVKELSSNEQALINAKALAALVLTKLKR